MEISKLFIIILVPKIDYVLVFSLALEAVSPVDFPQIVALFNFGRSEGNIRNGW